MASQPAVPNILLVVHDFIARSSDELTLEKGDRIELIERDDDFGDGWYLGKHMIHGKTGLFPQVYTTPAPKGNVTPAITRHPIVATTAPPRSLASQPVRSVSTPSNIPSGPRPPSPTQPSHDSAAHQTSRPLKSPQTLTSPAESDNPVMNETLSVIDEHITDMRTPTSARLADSHPKPRGPRANPNPYDPEYRLSYINGHETDEEESHALSVTEVNKWTPNRVAEYLEDAGVDKQHCDVFRDQEISGEVLLTMEQSAIFIKEFELGSVGRRLKTWNKIKALQDEVKSAAVATAPSLHRSNSDYSANAEDSVPELHDHGIRSASAAQLPTQYLSPTDYASELRHRQSGPDRNTSVPVLSAAPPGRYSPDDRAPQSQPHRPESIIARPSAASIRQMNHARRTSSIDSKGSMPDMSPHLNSGHSRKVSLDRLWSMGTGHSERRASRSGQAGAHGRTVSGGSASFSPPGMHDQSPGLGPSPDGDGQPDHEATLDNNKRTRHRFLPKRLVSSVPHSRVPSGNDQDHAPAVAGAELLSPSSVPSSTPTTATSSGSGTPRAMRAVSQPKILPGKTTLDGLGSPIVTKLEYGPPSPALQSSEASSSAHSPSGAHGFSIFHKSSKAPTPRSASDVTGSERKQPYTTNISSPLQSPARTGSTTPSTETKSFEQQKSDDRHSTGSSNNATTSAMADPSGPKTRPARHKRFTSAYTRGLEKKPPLEQMSGCDYSGWMKKRSANIMGSWKPRLFVLRGRRLSYYYSENDTEEKGLIDISGHRVLPADDEKITGLHAQIAGAKSPAVSEASPKITTAAASDLATKNPADDDKDEGIFIFKLVPPREGMSKAVNFTKPAVHYFAVGSRKEGRLWMAALMRATIDYDATGAVTTSYNQETISLAKARARRERPPALREVSTKSGGEDQKTMRISPDPPRLDHASGLGIGGLANGSRISSSTGGTGAEDSSVDHKESIEIEHRPFNFQDLGESIRNVIPTSP